MKANDGKQQGQQQRKQPGQQGRDSGREQGAQQQQDQGGQGQQYGEGNYKATRDYNRGLKDHVEHHDIEKEARDAAPRNADEEREMEEAERIGRSKAKAADDPMDPELGPDAGK